MIIAVASGKGGTGKTLVATSLALSLKDKDRVQIDSCYSPYVQEDQFAVPLQWLIDKLGSGGD